MGYPVFNIIGFFDFAFEFGNCHMNLDSIEHFTSYDLTHLFFLNTQFFVFFGVMDKK
jgi:hypothetical protein